MVRNVGEERKVLLMAAGLRRHALARGVDDDRADDRFVREHRVDVARRVLGDHHPFTMTAVGSLAQVYERLERAPEAELLLKEALAGMQNALGPSHPETLAARSDLLDFYERGGRAEDFTRLMAEQVGRMKEAARQADASANLLNNAAYLLATLAPEALREPAAARRIR